MSDKRIPSQSTSPLGRLPRLNRKKAAGAKSAEPKPTVAPRDEADTFIDEVSDELRRDQLYASFRKYGPFALGAVVALVVGTAVYEWRDSAAEDAARAAGGALLAAEESQAKPAEKADLLLAAADGEGAQLVAELRAAELKREAGDEAGALALYRGIAARPGLAPKYADLAAIKAVMVELDSGEPEALIATLQPLTAAGRPYRPLALELRATLELRQGDTDAARRTLSEALEGSGATRGVATRAGQLLEALGGPLEAPKPAVGASSGTAGGQTKAEKASEKADGEGDAASEPEPASN